MLENQKTALSSQYPLTSHSVSQLELNVVDDCLSWICFGVPDCYCSSTALYVDWRIWFKETKCVGPRIHILYENQDKFYRVGLSRGHSHRTRSACKVWKIATQAQRGWSSDRPAPGPAPAPAPAPPRTRPSINTLLASRSSKNQLAHCPKLN